MFVNTFKLLSFLAFKLLIMKGSFCMPITEILERNAREFGNDVALVEVNPEIRETRLGRNMSLSSLIQSVIIAVR